MPCEYGSRQNWIVGAEGCCGGPEPGSEVAVEGLEVVDDDPIADNGSLSVWECPDGAITGCQNVE